MIRKTKSSSTTFLFALVDNSKSVFVIMSVIIAALIVDTSIIKIYYFSINPSLPSWGIVVFFIVSSIFIVGQFFVFRLAKQRTKENRIKNLDLNLLHKVVMAVQYVLTAILAFIILQMVVMSHYNVSMIATAIAISYALAIIILGLLTVRFFLWFKLNRNFVILLYGLSSLALTINALFTLLFVTSILANQPVYIRPHIGLVSPFFAPGSITSLLNYVYVISSIVSFMLSWAATVLLLRHYSRKWGTIRYWVILSIPLTYFLIQFEPLFLNLFYAFEQSDPLSFSIVYTLIFTFSRAIGGLLFGLAFWTMARKLSHNNVVRNYMIISAYGFVLLFVSNQAVVLTSAPYPPFGLVTISFMGLSSYLVLVGIYSSAVSMAQDVKLRLSIRKSAIEQSKLLDSIAIAEVEKEIELRVLKIAKNQQEYLVEQTGIQLSLNEDEAKQYLEEVLEEVKKEHKR